MPAHDRLVILPRLANARNGTLLVLIFCVGGYLFVSHSNVPLSDRIGFFLFAAFVLSLGAAFFSGLIGIERVNSVALTRVGLTSHDWFFRKSVAWEEIAKFTVEKRHEDGSVNYDVVGYALDGKRNLRIYGGTYWDYAYAERDAARVRSWLEEVQRAKAIERDQLIAQAPPALRIKGRSLNFRPERI